MARGAFITRALGACFPTAPPPHSRGSTARSTNPRHHRARLPAHCRPTLLSARARPVGAAAAPRLLAVPTPTTTAAARTATPTRVVTASSQMANRRPFPTSTARRVCVPPHGSTMVSAAQAVPTPCASPCTDRVASLPMAHRPPPTMHRVRLRRHLRQCTSSRLRRLPTRRRHPGVHARRSRMAFLGTAPAT